MKIDEMNAIGPARAPKEPQRQVYVPPRIVTYTSEQILEQVGPALTCSGEPSCPVSP